MATTTWRSSPRTSGSTPGTDFEWVTSPGGNPMEVFADRQADAFLAFPPEPQELRDRNIGRVIISTIQDKPWSQYLCCVLFSSKEFVRDHPIATKRYLRAILKSADYCADQPEKAARRLVDAGSRYEYAVQTLTEILYREWRYYGPEDTMRFYALRLHEAGMIRSSPNADFGRGHGLALPERAQARAQGVRHAAALVPALEATAGP